MSYQIETRTADDLIIVRHYHYNSAAELQAYLDELTERLQQHSYRRLLADYSALTEVKLDFFDKLKIISSRCNELVELCRDTKQATVTINDFQKAIAQQARTIGCSDSGESTSRRVHYFNDVQQALEWLMGDEMGKKENANERK
jgi:hypothetical protein